MQKVNSLIISYLDQAQSHSFSRVFGPFRDKTCQEIWDTLRTDQWNEKIFDEIGNILEWEDLKVLRDFLYFLSKYWALEISSNIWNEFEEEKEIKILDVNISTLIKKLKYLWAKLVFDWFIDDIYLDLPWNILEKMSYKVSFRIRHKFSKDGHFCLYYTIKRKKNSEPNQEIPTRICYEKEFEIKSPWMVLDGLGLIKLAPYRRKIKQRIAYVLDWVKFDIDIYTQIPWYNQIPPLLEIETDDVKLLPWIIHMLWLQNNQVSDSWSRWMHEKIYKIPPEAHLIRDWWSWLYLPEQVLEHSRKLQEKKSILLKN